MILFKLPIKKVFILAGLVVVAMALTSWGYKGHNVVALIAEKHLDPSTRDIVNSILQGESIESVSTWADEVKRKPEYRSTSSWHYINVPSGLSHDAFINAVKQDKGPNIYTAILDMEHKLSSPGLTPDKQQECLKFLIHLVGDAHQPFHVGRKEDKGGNTIQVRFDGKGTNLHALWDSKLIDHEGMEVKQMAVSYDKADAGEIKQWQADEPIEWLWESYTMCSAIYNRVSKGQDMSSDFTGSIFFVHHRLEQAGIRLAGELNRIYKGTIERVHVAHVVLTPPPPLNMGYPKLPHADLKDVKTLIGEKLSTEGKVYSIKKLQNMTLVNVGGDYPNQLLTVVLKGEARKYFSDDYIVGKVLRVSGTVTNFKGKPEIVVKDSKDLGILSK